MFLHPQSVDALIFDMDGTLWNATASYAQVWNVALLQFGIEAHFTASDMLPFMGMPIELIMNGLLSQYTQLDHAKFLDLAFKLEIDMMPQLGGVLYPGVRDRLEKLSKFYKLFLLSNCGAQGLKNFMNFTGTQPLITDSISYGENPVPKSQNLQYLIAKHGLKNPLYMGDTQADANEAHKAGLPFVHAAYGFGKCHDAELSFNSFTAFASYFLATH